jgi:MarR family transcriptional regulator, 2-MHQ and catechol-resistance regulon repressor
LFGVTLASGILMPRQLAKIQTRDSSGLHLWLVLWKTYSAVREFAVRDIDKLGLTLTDFGILEALLNKGPLAVNDIGAKVALTSGSMTTAIDRLKSRGLVERRGVETDRRARIVHLTESGQRLISAAFAKHAAALDALGEELSAIERQQAIRLLKKLGHAAAARLESE